MGRIDISDFARKLDALVTTYSRLPTEIATIAVNFSKERFREQAWFDQTKEPWTPRKRARKGSGRRSQTLLVDKGRLKRSIRKISATTDKVVIGTDVPYAEIHNNGGVINQVVSVKQHTRKAHSRSRKGRKESVKEHIVKSHRRKMNVRIPARPFLGNSQELQRRILEHITSRFEQALNS